MSDPIDPNVVAPVAAAEPRGAGLARLTGYGLILAAGLGVSAFFAWQSSHEYSLALDKHRSLSMERAKTVAADLEATLNQIYQNLRTISMLPSIMDIDRHGANIDDDARMSIQQIYNNLAINIDLSEVYVAPEDFDPEAIDPVTGRAQEPILTYDEFVTAFPEQPTHPGVRGAREGGAPAGLALPEIGIFEFVTLRETMTRLRRDFPTAASFDEFRPPLISSPKVLTSDNTDYNRTQEDQDRMGVMFSVPFYGTDGRLRGSVSAVVRVNALRRLLPVADYVLVNAATRFATTRPSAAERGADAWAMRGEADPGLLFSVALPLKVERSESEWRLWVGHADAAFLGSPEVARIENHFWVANAFCFCATLLAMLLWAVVSRRRIAELAQWRDLSDASIEGLVICDGDRLTASNRSFDRLLGAPPDGVVGRGLSAVIPDEDVRRGLHAIDGDSIEAELLRDDGVKIPVEVISRQIAYLGRPHRVLAVRDLRERKAAEENMRFLAQHDPLTQLANRRRFNEVLDAAMAEVRPDAPFAVLCLDLDRFKPVNDVLGHPVGDELLRQVARRLEQCVAERDTVARIGGDEFAIVQVAADQPKAATHLADRVIEALTTPFMIQQHRVVVGTSVGAAIAPNDGAESDTLLKNADLALYRAKTDGRGVCRLFEDGMDAQMRARRQMEVELKNAFGLGEFDLFYQPQVDAADGRLRGFEALLRWRHPYHGEMEPSEFLPMAEELGLMKTIGAWVMREACRQARTWPEHLRVAVNVSPQQFKGGSVELDILEALGASGLAADRFELEITESVFLENSEATVAMLKRLRDAGVRVALDDFGTGYSSLSYLSSFPFNKIKIDRSFVRQSDDDPTALAIIRAVIGLGRGLGMSVTAEGVETEAQRQRLALEGCAELQGYLFGKPVAVKKLPDLMRSLERRAGAMAASG